MQQIELLAILALLVIVVVKLFTRKEASAEMEKNISEIKLSLSRLEQILKDEFRSNREESIRISRENREELSTTLEKMIGFNAHNLKEINATLDQKLEQLRQSASEANKNLRAELDKSLTNVQQNFDRNVESFNKLQKEKFEQLEARQTQLVTSTEKKLEEMRETVDEKLNKTLADRLGQSFETVGKQLQEVQQGLGEMRTLATDVGGLKKVLSNVKMRGSFGEVQLSALLEQILAPAQYEPNVKTKNHSKDLVEFAIKLPGKEEGLDHIWLPIDAKFPSDRYAKLQDAYDVGDAALIEVAQKELEVAVKNMAKDIRNKYLDPPYTTDFGIMFLPFEGIYAEVVRKAALLDELQRDYKVIVTGPSTLAALLNSLQMGFKTLAIQKSSSEVWKILGGVKTEFEKFGGLLDKAKKNIQSGLDDIDTLVGTRSNMIRRQLKNVEAIPETEVSKIMLQSIGTDEQ